MPKAWAQGPIRANNLLTSEVESDYPWHKMPCDLGFRALQMDERCQQNIHGHWRSRSLLKDPRLVFKRKRAPESWATLKLRWTPKRPGQKMECGPKVNEGACGWVRRGHAAQIGPPQVSICGPHSPMEIMEDGRGFEPLFNILMFLAIKVQSLMVLGCLPSS